MMAKIYNANTESGRIDSVISELYLRVFDKSTSDGIRIPEPLGHFDDLAMVLMEYVSMPTMYERLDSSHLEQDLAMVGKALAKLHSVSLNTTFLKDGKTYRARDLVAKLNNFVAKVADIDKEVGTVLQHRLADTIKKADDSNSPSTALVHGSIKSKNVLVDDGTAILIDLDGVGTGESARDVAELLWHLMYQGFRRSWSDEKTRNSCDSFLDAYGRARASGMKNRIDFYCNAFRLLNACFVINMSKDNRETALKILTEIKDSFTF